MPEQKFSFFIKLNFLEMFRRSMSTEEVIDHIEKNFPAPDWSTVSHGTTLNAEPLVKSWEDWHDVQEKICKIWRGAR